MSNKKPPPVPSQQRSPKGPGSDPAMDKKRETSAENTEEQGEQGNIHQNTTNQGYQQDR
jgi:hypothetical protein